MSASASSSIARIVEGVAAIAGLSALVCAAWWAWGTAGGTRTGSDAAEPASAGLASDGSGLTENGTKSALAPIELTAFDAPIWYAPPAAPEPLPAPVVVETKPAPPPPPPPLKFQLIAIATRSVPARDGSASFTVFQAIVYDPDNDTLVTLETGQALAPGRSVELVDAASVSFRDGTHIRRLALREPDPLLDGLMQRSRSRSSQKERTR